MLPNLGKSYPSGPVRQGTLRPLEVDILLSCFLREDVGKQFGRSATVIEDFPRLFGHGSIDHVLHPVISAAGVCAAGDDRSQDRKASRTPVGDGRIGGQFWIVEEHGMKAGYVRNIASDPRVRLKLRSGILGRWHTGTAHLLTDDDPRERQRWLASQLPSSAANASVVRAD